MDLSASLKCANCFLSETLCDNEVDCPAGKVCYTIKNKRYTYNSYLYEAGCGLKETHCGQSWYQGGLLARLRGETKCCETDMCNKHLTFSTDIKATTTPPPFQLSKGIECQVCSGPTCGVMGDDPVIRCLDEFPLCMNIVINGASGSKMVTKRCAKRSECQRKDNAPCANFDPSEIYPTSMECIYCCETNRCNKDIVPRADTLIMG